MKAPMVTYLATSNGGLSHLTLIDQQRKLDLNSRRGAPGVISSSKFDSTGKRLALTLKSAVRHAMPDAEPDESTHPLDPERARTHRRRESDHASPGALSDLGSRRQPAAHAIGHAYRRPARGQRCRHEPRRWPASGADSAAQRAARQYRRGFSLVQFLVNELGFVVLAPNVRGAAGFGRSFSELARGLRDDATRDVGSLLVWIGLQHELDFNHIMVMARATAALSRWPVWRSMAIGCAAASPPFRRTWGWCRTWCRYAGQCAWEHG